MLLMTALTCLSLNTYFEARGESLNGQVLVAQVTKNRLENGKFGNSMCHVVMKRKQFSWTTEKLERFTFNGTQYLRFKQGQLPKDSQAWRQAVYIAQGVMHGEFKDISHGALYFHTKQVKPDWSLGRGRAVAVEGNHLFFKQIKSSLNYNKA